jgi:hypothetical protein
MIGILSIEHTQQLLDDFFANTENKFPVDIKK